MKIIATLILVSLSFLTSGQEEILIDQPFRGLPSYYKTNVIEVDSLNQLPSIIQFISNNIINKSMTDFIDNIRFVKGQIIDLDKWLKNDSIPQTEYNYIIPKYELFFELSDSSLGIKNFCFELNLDQYGQVIFLEWPRENYNKRINFINPNQIKAEAIKYAKEKKYKTETCVYKLKFDSKTNSICWYISFLQEFEGDENWHRKSYKTVVIDAISLMVMYELDMVQRLMH